MKIEVKTYEESRLEFFKDLARKAEKKLDKCIRAMKQSDYDNPLSENHIALDDAVEIKGLYCDIVDMLYTDKAAKWISVEERLPNDKDYVLVTDGRKTDLGWFEVEDGLFASYLSLCDEDNITHWMPLPEAPKERVEE